MKILAINGTCRKKGTTTKLTQSALEGAASRGAETEMILLMDKNIEWCQNCLKCYGDMDSLPFGPCMIDDDDMLMILQKMDEADGVIFSTPVHNGLATGRMIQFVERMTFRLCKPGGDFGGLRACPQPRRTDKVWALASIASAGGMPGSVRKFCDPTPWLKDAMVIGLNGHWIGDIYADAVLKKKPETDDDWNRIFFLRKLTDGQLAQARELGVKMADTLSKGNLQPTPLPGSLTDMIMRIYLRFTKGYETTSEGE